MFNFANIDLQRIVTAAVGAFMLSTACVGAAIAPATGLESGSVQAVEQTRA